MTSPIEEFEEILGVETLVDMNKLRSSSRFGIPDQVRGLVWKYLLGVENPDRGQELSAQKSRFTDYAKHLRDCIESNGEVLKRVRAEVRRYQKTREKSFRRRLLPRIGNYQRVNGLNSAHSSPGSSPIMSANDADFILLSAHLSDHYSLMESSLPSLDDMPDCDSRPSSSETNFSQISVALENSITVYLHMNHYCEYRPNLVYLCGPFVYVLLPGKEHDVHDCFAAFFKRLEEYFLSVPVNTLTSNFIMLFRTLQPDLYTYFEDEDVNMQEWTQSWFENMLAKELPLECVVRLWDTYLSVTEGFGLHLYVCLAVLLLLKESLEELEQGEIRATLSKLPALDMDQVIGQAFNILNDVSHRGIVI